MIEQIEQVPAWRFGNTVYPTFSEAQHAGIAHLFADDGVVGDKIADTIISHKDEVIGILTGTKPRKPRADRGRSHRKPQPPAEVKDSPEPGVLPGVKVEASSKYRNK